MNKDLTSNKWKYMNKLSSDDGIISALAIDQRGALKKMMLKSDAEPTQENLEEFKIIVSQELTPYATSILLDPEYGLPAAKVRDENAGLLLAYEKTGYDINKEGRLPDLLNTWSVKRIKESGADAVKFLLYYDVDEDEKINKQKKAFVERIGSECLAEDIPFFLELLSYDASGILNDSKEYAKIKPHKVNAMMREFSGERYAVDVLKVEVPVNMKYVEGYGVDAVYSQKEAAEHFLSQSQSTNIPFIFLSAGVSAKLFQETLIFANNAGSTFNGVLCGRATWANGVDVFAKDGSDAAVKWMRSEGRQNIEELNEVVMRTAKSWMH
ncbi:tagatose-bisphosphate aldolase [Vagococcus lutrae]|uniref:Tagatose 1,6-diphosphate aldolase n=1 Tax=Vagococcus lutrae TaxID=81947 RepID=A0AAF0BHV6_9ENTE|nr:tagatose-bisphosphate aldolase [Vagococcus lutrae]WCG22895.1 tagatose-bisphosphate aldolase [Vagococcus lutrae]